MDKTHRSGPPLLLGTSVNGGEFIYCKTRDKLADTFIKACNKEKFKNFRTLLGVTNNNTYYKHLEGGSR